MKKIEVGVIGATGMVGQNYIQLLAEHPWFEVTYVAASPRSANQKYQDAVAGRWLMDTSIPEAVSGLVVGDANKVEQVILVRLLSTWWITLFLISVVRRKSQSWSR